MKRIVSTALAAVMLASAPAASAAELLLDTTAPASPDASAQEQTVGTPVAVSNYTVNGKDVNFWALNRLSLVQKTGVVSIEDGELKRIIITAADNKDDVLVLNTDDTTTRVLDAATGDVKALADIKAGDTITVFVSPAMTMSMPPQSHAELILVGASEKNPAPVYAEINSISKSDDGKEVTLKLNNEKSVVLNETTTVNPFLTRQLLTKDTLIPGQMVLVWTDAAASTTATKVLAFNTGYQGTIAITDNADTAYGMVLLNGEAVSFEAPATPYIEGTEYYLPLRKVAETLGFQVKWDGAARTVTLLTSDGTAHSTVNLDQQSIMVTLGGNGSVATDAAVTLKDGVTMISTNELISMLNLKLVH